jgi:formylglycine-generating enzyme required for sulfatase activity
MKKLFFCNQSLVKKTLMLFTVFFTVISLNANNVQITNIVNTNPGSANPEITFDIKWDNSWNVSGVPNNYDAVWIFVKCQKVPKGTLNCESNLEWEHANMANSKAGFSAAAPLTYELVSDSVGLFLYRSGNGIGNIPTTSVTIVLDLPIPDSPYAKEYNFKVFALEMVYIPQGNFELGDGISHGSFNSITINNSTSTLDPGVVGGGIHSTIPAEFPKGYSAFYCMKYEITQQQYVDFLNTLTFNQQITRTNLNAAQLATDPGNGLCAIVGSCVNRNSIKLIQHGINSSRPGVFACDFQPAPGDPFNSPNDGLTIAMNYLSLADFYAYLDWAGLRPMTNFEFEKMARGPLARIGKEYIWGTQNITQAQSTELNHPGTASEVSNTSGNGLAAYGSAGINGPLRVGFSATDSTTRETSGSSYYGVMNLGGNVWEIVAGGSNFNNNGYKLTYSNLGNGRLNSAGNHNVANWLTYGSYSYSQIGCGCCSNYIKWHIELRGGSYSSAASTLRTSDRSKNYGPTCGWCPDMGFGNAGDQRQADVGGRGVR